MEIEQEGLGVVRAASLEYEEEVAVLESACFETGQLRFDARVARAVEAGVDAQDVQLSGPGLQGRAQRASSEGTELRLFGVDLVLTLPSLVFGAVPLPPGQYALMADRADVLPEGGLRLGDAALTHLQTRDRYRLVDALLQGERLSAARAELVRIETTQLQARPNRVSAGPSELGLCRDPRSRELALRASSFVATPQSTILTGARLQLFGLGLPSFGTVTLPITARGDTLGESLGNLAGSAQAFGERVSRVAPQLLTGEGRFGVRDLPLFDATGSRLNVAVHPRYLEFGVRTSVDGADVEIGIFQDPDTEGRSAADDRPLPQLALTRRPVSGLQLALAFRGSDELSESRVGYAWNVPLSDGTRSASAQLLLEAGWAHQVGLTDAFARVQPRLDGTWRAGALGVDVRALIDAYALAGGSQLNGEAAVRFGVTQGQLKLFVEQVERQVWGRALLPALQVDPARTTGFGASLTPAVSFAGVELRTVGYLSRFDWRSQRFDQGELSATLAARVLDSEVVPTLSYDWAQERLGLRTEVTRSSECFAYGVVVEAYRFPDRSGLSARLKLNLR